MQKMFASPAKTSLDIRAVESYRALMAPALEYLPAGTTDHRAGVLYVNTLHHAAGPTYLAAAQYLADGIPGRHYKADIAQRDQTLPLERRYAVIEAFDDG